MTTETTTEAFPIEWDDPADAERTWQYDPVHLANAVTPVDFELGLGPFLEGFGWGMLPKHFNYYVFYTMQPRDGSGPMGPGKPALEDIHAGGRRWFDEVLPEVLRHTERYRNTDFVSMSNDELLDEIDRLKELRYRSGQLHTMALVPAFQGYNQLVETYKELTGGEELGAVRLIQGHPNKSFESCLQLWQVSRVAAETPAVRERLTSFDENTQSQVLDELRREPAARPFIDAFDAYLEEYGWRSAGGVSSVTWAEDPSVALTVLRKYLETEGYDLVAEQQRLNDDRDAAIRDALASLDGDARTRLQDSIDAARSVCMLSEDHNFYIDQRLYTMPRRLLLAVGERLVVAAAIAQTDDVFYLRTAELQSALRGESSALAATAARRREEFDHFKNVKPPRYVGVTPPGQPEEAAPSAVETDRDASELRGMGVSAGVVRGVARVVPTLNDAARLRPGDVLVASVTQPAWTPLFGIARAVVTEQGGMLSHTAIASREFGIPAVVAIADVTRLLRDGQLVEVDGAAGTVRIIA